MNLSDYFDPSEALPNPMGLGKNASVYGRVQILGISSKVTIDETSLVIFGVTETRNSNNPGAAQSADAVRSFLYGLSGSTVKQPLVDLGNLKQTGSPADTYMATRDVLEYLMGKGATCVVIGGTQEITWPLYLAVAQNVQQPNVSIIDYTIDMGNNDGDFSSSCYIDRILADGKDQLFSLNVLGYQGYLVDNHHIDTLSARNFDLMRLGYVRGAMSEVEPLLRDSHIISFDMGCIKQSDSPGVVYPSPNGFYSEEICQLARYSGVSSNAKVFGLFELNTLSDPNGLSSSLAAHIVWHFIDGYNARHKYPSYSSSAPSIKRFYIKSPIPNVELVFLQNTITDAWWFELPQTAKTNGKSIVVACSRADYEKASKGDVPDRWMRIWNRIR